jgi:hypothetical protein
MQALFTISGVGYLLIYAFEGAIRYALYGVGQDNAILLRDALMVVPLAVLFVTQAFRMSVHPAFVAFAVIVALHGGIATLNLHTTLPAIYGAKLLITVLFGFIAGWQLTQPTKTVLAILSLVWLATIIGVTLDKFIYTFPWMGMETHVGGIAVDVSRGWDIDGGFEKRAAGFTRSSISAAMLIPTLALLIAPRTRNIVLRFLVVMVTIAVVALTTQKGALIAIIVVGMLLFAPEARRYSLLTALCLTAAILDVVLPVLTAGMLVPETGGVFSLSSFALRITRTWPDAWRWIEQSQIFPFGVGLGGIGGAQRFYAEDFFNPSDNFAVFLYANFGILGLFYLGWISHIGRGLPAHLRPMAVPALAIIAFNLLYGIVLSMLEDQVSALFIGAGAGALWQLHRLARGRRWSDPYRGAPVRFPVTPLAAYFGRGDRRAAAR